MKLLRIDSSARSQASDRSSRGSHTRRLTERFTRRWLQQRPNDVLISRDVGQSPPLDLVAAEAEVAADREQLIIAETTVKQVEDQLRALIFDTSDRSVWTVMIDPVDPPPVGLASPDLDAAVANALRDRADLARARKDIDNAQVGVKFTGNQRLPDVRLNASYLASGLGGTQVLRTGGFPGAISGSGGVTDFGSVLNQLFTGKYSTWAVGLSVSYPIGQATEEEAKRQVGARAVAGTAQECRVPRGTTSP